MLRNGIWGRFLVVLAVAGLLAAQGSTIRAQGADGEAHSNCITTCNETHMSCVRVCVTECKDMWRGDDEAQQACETECKDVCTENQSGCQTICEENKFPTSEEDPN